MTSVLGFAIAIQLLVFCPQAASAQSNSQDQQLTAALAGFTSPQWPDRAKAFYAVLDLAARGPFDGRTWAVGSMVQDLFKRFPQREEETKSALIRLLVTENAKLNVPTPHDEDYGNYYGDLLGTVADLHDKRAVEPLLVNIGRGGMATSGLASFGKDAVDLVLAKIGDGNVVIRQSVVITIAKMLDPDVHASLDAAAVQRIKAALLDALKDQSFFVQIAAIDGLKFLPGDDVTAILQKVAAEDPFHRPSFPVLGGISYPVREAAQKALAQRAGRSDR